MPQIVDINGHPIDMAAIREPQTAKVGHLQREFENHPARGITPARLHQIMVSAERGDLIAQLELADDMEERDAHLYAEMGKRRGAITALEWSIEEPEEASAEEKDLTARVRDWMGMVQAHANGVDGGIDVVLGTMTDAMLKGFAPQEMVWDYVPDGSGRKVMVPKITAQPQRWFTTSADRRRFLLRALTVTHTSAGLPAVAGMELLPLAWLNHVHPARNGYLARMSLARVLFWPYLFKNYAIRDLAEFLEIYGLPMRLGSYPTGASSAEKLTLLQAVTQIGHNAAGIVPQNMKLEFMAAAAGTDGPFGAMWDRMDAAESKAILGQTLTASEGQHGTQALGNVHNDVRMDIRAADARLISESITRQLIHRLVLVNKPGVNPQRMPRLMLDTGEPEDLQAYADNLPKLAKAGLKIGRKWAQDKLRIPEPAEGEDLLTGDAPAPAPLPALPGAPAKPMPPALAAADAARQKQALVSFITSLAAAPALQAPPTAAQSAGPAPDLIDALVAEQVDQWQPLLGPMVEPLLAELEKAVAAGETLAAFATRVPDLVRYIDAQPLTTSLAQAAFAARLAGEADIDV